MQLLPDGPLPRYDGSAGSLVPAGAQGSSSTSAERERLVVMEKIIHASRSIATRLDPFAACEEIVRQSKVLLECDRATMFNVDEGRHELLVHVAHGMDQIRVPIGTGISGTVAATGEIINIQDAYADDRFAPEFDKKTGYKTKSILCAPIPNAAGQIVGVIQAINRHDHEFTEIDEEVAKILASQAGVALQNARVYHQMMRSEAKVRSFIEVIEALHQDLGISSLMFTITERVHTLLESDRCTIYLYDKSSEELWSVQGEVNLRFPVGKGIAGQCLTAGEVINIPEAYEDARFNQASDQKTGYRTRTILCMPIFGAKPDFKRVGVIQVINKKEGPFTEDDEQLLKSFFNIAGPLLESCTMFQKTNQEKPPEFPGGGKCESCAAEETREGERERTHATKTKKEPGRGAAWASVLLSCCLVDGAVHTR